MVFTRHLVGGLLAELEEVIDRDKFKRLLHYSRRLGNFQNRVKLVCKLTFSPQAPNPSLRGSANRPSRPAVSTVPGSPCATYLIHYLPFLTSRSDQVQGSIDEVLEQGMCHDPEADPIPF